MPVENPADLISTAMTSPAHHSCKMPLPIDHWLVRDGHDKYDEERSMTE